ncbi:hypothetical protein MRX96_024155 [Rhipicephalus microplus]
MKNRRDTKKATDKGVGHVATPRKRGTSKLRRKSVCRRRHARTTERRMTTRTADAMGNQWRQPDAEGAMPASPVFSGRGIKLMKDAGDHKEKSIPARD